MLLLVDAGNTRVKWALVDAGAELGCWRAFGSVSQAEVGTLAQAWQGLQFSRVLLSNVAGATLRQSLQAVLAIRIAAKADRVVRIKAATGRGQKQLSRSGPARL